MVAAWPPAGLPAEPSPVGAGFATAAGPGLKEEGDITLVPSVRGPTAPPLAFRGGPGWGQARESMYVMLLVTNALMCMCSCVCAVRLVTHTLMHACTHARTYIHTDARACVRATPAGYACMCVCSRARDTLAEMKHEAPTHGHTDARSSACAQTHAYPSRTDTTMQACTRRPRRPDAHLPAR